MILMMGLALDGVAAQDAKSSGLTVLQLRTCIELWNLGCASYPSCEMLQKFTCINVYGCFMSGKNSTTVHSLENMKVCACVGISGCRFFMSAREACRTA